MIRILTIVFFMVAVEKIHCLKGPCSIDAALTWVGNDKMYLFKGDKYARWDDDKDILGPVSPISAWKGIPNNLDAATTWGGKNYFFKGCQYWRYYSDDSSDGPHDIKAWKIPCNIDAAATWGGKTYFFKGNQYWRWHGDKFNGPTGISAWKNLEPNIDAGVQWDKNGKTYLLKGKKYWRYTGEDVAIGNVAGGWRGLLDGGLLPQCDCDCNSCCNDNWKFDSISFDVNQGKVVKLPPEVVATQVVDNRKGTAQPKVTFIATKTVTETKSFTHTVGASVTVGTSFKCGVPLIAEGSVSVEVSASYSFEYGKQYSVEKSFSSTFECPGVAGKFTKCKAMLHSNKMDVPYTMIMKHKTKGCKCKSKGFYTAVSSYSLNLVVDESQRKK